MFVYNYNYNCTSKLYSCNNYVPTVIPNYNLFDFLIVDLVLIEHQLQPNKLVALVAVI